MLFFFITKNERYRAKRNSFVAVGRLLVLLSLADTSFEIINDSTSSLCNRRLSDKSLITDRRMVIYF